MQGLQIYVSLFLLPTFTKIRRYVIFFEASSIDYSLFWLSNPTPSGTYTSRYKVKRNLDIIGWLQGRLDSPKGAFTNYVDKILPIIDRLSIPCWHFEYHLPTSSCQRSLWAPPYLIMDWWKLTWFMNASPVQGFWREDMDTWIDSAFIFVYLRLL